MDPVNHAMYVTHGCSHVTHGAATFPTALQSVGVARTSKHVLFLLYAVVRFGYGGYVVYALTRFSHRFPGFSKRTQRVALRSQ